MMQGYQIAVRSGPNKGLTWTLQDKALVVGRDTDCDIVIADALVSRRHCELNCRGDEIYVRDLGSRNATLVNGRPVDGCRLQVGDEVSVGTVSFILTRRVLDPPIKEENAALDRTRHFLEPKTVYPRSSAAHMPQRGLPSTVVDMSRLFDAWTSFSLAESIGELVHRIEEALTRRLGPKRCWIGVLNRDKLELLVKPETPYDPDGFPKAELQQTLDMAYGALLAPPSMNAARAGLQVMAAPIHIGQAHIGGIVLESDSPYEEADVAFLSAVAQGAAPFFGSIEHRRFLEQEVELLRLDRQKSLEIIGNSDVTERLRYLVQLVAKTDHAILILGETGAGKELVAGLIHELSRRNHGPFVAVNCAAISNEMFESVLFGHERGAFTGAIEHKIGMMKESHGGTLFLDEVGDLSLQNQARILRAIETHTFRPLGGKKDIEADFRVLAATNKDLQAAIQSGEFRGDLYHRLRSFEVRVPALRERVADIPLLAEYFLNLARNGAKRPIHGFTPEAMAYLKAYSWPGNVRELRRTIEAAVVLAEGEYIGPEVLSNGDPVAMGERKPTTLAAMERSHIERALKYCNGNTTEAAHLLGIHRSTLYDKLGRYGIAH
jgi:Nif-specific regulatory protein